MLESVLESMLVLVRVLSAQTLVLVPLMSAATLVLWSVLLASVMPGLPVKRRIEWLRGAADRWDRLPSVLAVVLVVVRV